MSSPLSSAPAHTKSADGARVRYCARQQVRAHAAPDSSIHSKHRSRAQGGRPGDAFGLKGQRCARSTPRSPSRSVHAPAAAPPPPPSSSDHPPSPAPAPSSSFAHVFKASADGRRGAIARPQTAVLRCCPGRPETRRTSRASSSSHPPTPSSAAEGDGDMDDARPAGGAGAARPGAPPEARPGSAPARGGRSSGEGELLRRARGNQSAPHTPQSALADVKHSRSHPQGATRAPDSPARAAGQPLPALAGGGGAQVDWRQRTSRRAPRRPSRRRHRPSPPPAPAESGRDHLPPSRRRARASRRAALSRRPRRPRCPPPRRCTLAGTASAAARARAAPPSQAGPALCAPRPPQRLAAPALSGPRAADVRAGVCSVLVGRPSPTSSLRGEAAPPPPAAATAPGGATDARCCPRGGCPSSSCGVARANTRPLAQRFIRIRASVRASMTKGVSLLLIIRHQPSESKAGARAPCAARSTPCRARAARERVASEPRGPPGEWWWWGASCGARVRGEP